MPDTLAALEQVAAWARDQWGGRVIGVTGSAGKTTTKEIIAELLAVEMPVGKSIGNLNNHVGLPLSILRLPAEARAAVLEIGMNHPGEIRRLASIARPEVGVVTNVGFAHAEFFESMDEVALAKRELIEALPPEGVAVLNADDPRVARFREIHAGRAITFGTSPEAEVRPAEVEYTPAGVRFRLGSTDFECSLAGRHGVLNVLAGIAVAGVFGIAPERLREAVRSLEPGENAGRALHPCRDHDSERLLQLQPGGGPRDAGRASGYAGAAPGRRAGGDARTRPLDRAFAPGRRQLRRCVRG